MRWLTIGPGVALLGLAISSCAPSGPSTLEIIDTLETSANEKDLEGMMALFAEDAVVNESFRQKENAYIYTGEEEIYRFWSSYFLFPMTHEFRDATVDGDTATFGWVQRDPVYTKLYPVRIEVQNGKITYMDFYEESQILSNGDE